MRVAYTEFHSVELCRAGMNEPRSRSATIYFRRRISVKPAAKHADILSFIGITPNLLICRGQIPAATADSAPVELILSDANRTARPTYRRISVFSI